MNKNVLIVGTGAVGLFIGFLLKSEINKYYIGKGFSYKYLRDRISIITENFFCKPKSVFNINKYEKDVSIIGEIDCLIIAIRENDFDKIDEELINLCQSAKCVLIICNTISSFNFLKEKIKNLNTYMCIITSGIKHISPNLVFTIDSKLKIIIQAKIEQIPKIFKRNKQVFLSKKNINSVLIERYFKNAISFLTILNKCNVGELFEKQHLILSGIFSEISEKLVVEGGGKNIFKKIESDTALSSYYPSEYESFYLRGKIFNWTYFYNDCKLLFGNDLTKQKFLSNLFTQLQEFK
jgi:ketopantoate reductase